MVHNTRKEPDFSAKLPFAQIWAKLPESTQPIRLLHFQNAVTSKPYDCFLKFFVWSLSTMRGINRKLFGGN